MTYVAEDIFERKELGSYNSQSADGVDKTSLCSRTRTNTHIRDQCARLISKKNRGRERRWEDRIDYREWFSFSISTLGYYTTLTTVVQCANCIFPATTRTLYFFFYSRSFFLSFSLSLYFIDAFYHGVTAWTW